MPSIILNTEQNRKIESSDMCCLVAACWKLCMTRFLPARWSDIPFAMYVSICRKVVTTRQPSVTYMSVRVCDVQALLLWVRGTVQPGIPVTSAEVFACCSPGCLLPVVMLSLHPLALEIEMVPNSMRTLCSYERVSIRVCTLQVLKLPERHVDPRRAIELQY